MIELIENIWHEKNSNVKYKDIFNIITTLKLISNFIGLEADVIRKDSPKRDNVSSNNNSGSIKFFYDEEIYKAIENFLSKVNVEQKSQTHDTKIVLCPKKISEQQVKDDIFLINSIKNSFRHFSIQNLTFEVSNDRIYINNEHPSSTLKCDFSINSFIEFIETIAILVKKKTDKNIDVEEYSNIKKEYQSNNSFENDYYFFHDIKGQVVMNILEPNKRLMLSEYLFWLIKRQNLSQKLYLSSILNSNNLNLDILKILTSFSIPTNDAGMTQRKSWQMPPEKIDKRIDEIILQEFFELTNSIEYYNRCNDINDLIKIYKQIYSYCNDLILYCSNYMNNINLGINNAMSHNNILHLFSKGGMRIAVFDRHINSYKTETAEINFNMIGSLTDFNTLLDTKILIEFTKDYISHFDQKGFDLSNEEILNFVTNQYKNEVLTKTDFVDNSKQDTKLYDEEIKYLTFCVKIIRLYYYIYTIASILSNTSISATNKTKNKISFQKLNIKEDAELIKNLFEGNIVNLYMFLEKVKKNFPSRIQEYNIDSHLSFLSKYIEFINKTFQINTQELPKSKKNKK